MTRRTLAMIALGALAGPFFACLPELSPLNAPFEDAGPETTTIAPVNPCGDGFIDDDAGEECDPIDASTACVGCKVACPGVTDDASSHCYYVAEGGASTYQAATSACAGGHLVTIGSAREATFVDALDAGTYWVGASYEPALGGFGAAAATEPGFARDGGCPGCFARAFVERDAGGDCILATDAGWSLADCFDASATPLCEREAVGVRTFYCSGPYCATVKGATKRYLVYLPSEARSAEAAAQECARFEEGRLVVFESHEERERIVRELLLLGVSPPLEVWIGVANDGGTWRWDDGQPVDDAGRPSPWGDKQPAASAGRAFIRIGSAFYDSQLAQAENDDTTARPFICERK